MKGRDIYFPFTKKKNYQEENRNMGLESNRGRTLNGNHFKEMVIEFYTPDCKIHRTNIIPLNYTTFTPQQSTSVLYLHLILLL